MKRVKAVKESGAPFPIVGIGASAGGLEAVSRLLKALPDDTGLAFVVVQHLDPTRESLLPAILQKSTEMPVAQATDGEMVAPNRVYVIPPNTHMVIDEHRLKLIPRPQGVHGLAVDCFLNSLAEELGNQAIAVILSGSASDGAVGVRSIKTEGGVVFAQDEASSGHFGMPHSAAATGVVDFVLPPEKIAEELAQIARHPALNPDITDLYKDSASVARIFELLRRATGVDFGLYKPSTIKRRLLRRLIIHKLSTLEQYRRLLEKDVEEVRLLQEDLLIHVTRFFREPAAFAALRAKAFPRMLKGLTADAPIRVWVPGCSTGEEAYSIAIALFDYLSEHDCMNPVQIFATDLSDVALSRARKGVYSPEIKNFVAPAMLRRFFIKADRGYEVVKRVRDACVFARQDLTKDPPFANVDLISCCNVLIYLSPAIQKQILPMFHYALRRSGALLLGASETIGESGDLFSPADKRSRLYFKKQTAAKMYFPVRLPQQTALAGKPAPATKAPPVTWPEGDAQKIAERILLNRFAPAGVIVSRDLNVLHFRGPVSRYLEPGTGKASLNLLKMLPAHAATAVNALLQKARTVDTPVVARGLDLGGDDTERARKIDIEAIPFRLPVSGERFCIVLFEDAGSSSAQLGETRGKRPALKVRSEGASVKRLKSELTALRGYLQTVVEEHDAVNEELKSANEEIVSANEELQSTNEELEIAKEELQAANEELSTVNDELQTRNSDLGHLNDDLLNLITSVHLPIVMVSSDLRVRRFSPQAEKVLGLIPADIGRSIGDITARISLPDIEEIVHEVIETVTTKELEVRDREKHSYLVRIRPYKTAGNKIEGAVLVLLDHAMVARGVPGPDDRG
jgi:two-component system CheB/CheR fusion protein